MNLRQGLISLFVVCIAVIAADAQAACTGTVSVSQTPTHVRLDATISSSTCNGLTAMLRIPGFYSEQVFCPDGQYSCTVWREVPNTGLCAGTQTASIEVSCKSSTNGSCPPNSGSSTSFFVEPAPTIDIGISGPDSTGLAIATITYDLPRTKYNKRYDMRVISPSGQVVDSEGYQLGTASGSFGRAVDLSCKAPGTYTMKVTMRGDCPQDVVQTAPIVVTSVQPTVSVSVNATNAASPEAVVNYTFPGTKNSTQRQLKLAWAEDGALISQPGNLAASGTVRVPLPTCTSGHTRLRATATACGGYAAVAEAERPEAKPTVHIAVVKKGVVGGYPLMEATLDWDLKMPGGTIKVDQLSSTDAAGNVIPAASIRGAYTPATQAGTDVFTFVAATTGKQIRVRATAQACSTVTHDTAADCDTCDKTANPVFHSDGNMLLADVDPLPRAGGLSLVRTYNSDEQVVGFFGRGWTTVFDERLIADASTVSIVSPSNSLVTFSKAGSSFVQTWPLAVQALGTLRYDAASARYIYRAAGATETRTFASDGRLVGISDVAAGRDVVITYGSSGLPATLSDARTGVTWELTIVQRRVATVSVTGAPNLTWSYAYDTDGNLQSVTGPGSATWRTYEYAGNRMTASRDPLGNLIETHTYDANGFAVDSTGDVDEIANIQYNLPGSTARERITRITYKTGAIAEYTLRPSGGAWRSVRVTGGCASCGAREATYVRDVDGRIIRAQGEDGYITVNAYDSARRLVSKQEALKPAGCDPQTDSQHCRLDPDALASVTLNATPASVTLTYEHNDAVWPDKVTAVTRPSVLAAGQVRRDAFTYHPATGVVTSTTVSGWTGATPAQTQRQTVTAYYDAVDSAPAFTPGAPFDNAWLSLPQPSGLRKSVDGSRTDAADVTLFVYYPVDSSVPALLRGRLAAVKQPDGLILHFETYDLFGNATRVVDPNGVATEIGSDLTGRPLSSTVKGVSGCDTSADPLCASDLTTARTYASSVGPMQSEVLPRGGVTSYTYDGRGRIETVSRGPAANDLRERIETTYDPLTGKKNIERTLARENGTWVEKRRDSFTYDSEARLQTVTHPDNTAIHYTYDVASRIAAVRDERHTAANVQYGYDPMGRVASVKQLLNAATNTWITTSYAYDTAGNLTSVTDPNGNLTTYVFDDFGSTLKQTSPVTGVTTYVYDAAGNVLSSTDARGATTVRTYDASNRPVTVVSTLDTWSETVTYAYGDANASPFSRGRMTSATAPPGTTTYSYDRRGLLREELPFGGAYTQRYTYDADGNRTSIRYPSGGVVSYTYDYAGRQQTATGTLNGTSTPFVTSASYLPFGPVTSVVLGNGTTETRGYDARYRPAVLRLQRGVVTISDYAYTSDGVGNITSINDVTNAAYNRTFGYDDLNRLVTANSGAALWGAGGYTYDAMGNMLTASVAAGRTFSHAGMTPVVTSVTDTRFSPSTSVTHDAVGNEITSEAGDPSSGQSVEHRSYSPRNLLNQLWTEQIDCSWGDCTPSITLSRAIAYDARGVRVSEDYDSTATFFYTPELTPLNIASSSSGREADIVWFNGAPIGEQSPGGVRYTFTDHLGTPLIQTNTTGTVIWRAEYDPYGNVFTMRTGDAIDQPLRFPGQQVAYAGVNGEESYNIFRWYRAGWGRYTQADPLESSAVNAYLYARANPLSWVDSKGLYNHPPGGPYHSPFPTSCKPEDECHLLYWKLDELYKMIISHEQWMKSHPNDPTDHKKEIKDFYNARNNCMALIQKNCLGKKNCNACEKTEKKVGDIWVAGMIIVKIIEYCLVPEFKPFLP